MFILVSMISTAYVAHYNAPKFFAELKDATVKRYNTVVGSAFGFAILVYLLVMWVGFLSFGGNSTGFILNNYASTDKLATVARIAIGGGILCGYPLTFTALRDGAADLLRIPTEKVHILLMIDAVLFIFSCRGSSRTPHSRLVFWAELLPWRYNCAM